MSGYSGIGKSSVVNELHRVLVPPRGLFAAGKFDQYSATFPIPRWRRRFRASSVRSWRRATLNSARGVRRSVARWVQMGN